MLILPRVFCVSVCMYICIAAAPLVDTAAPGVLDAEQHRGGNGGADSDRAGQRRPALLGGAGVFPVPGPRRQAVCT